MPRTTDHGSMMAGSGLTLLMIHATKNPRAVPTTPPNVESVIDSVRICHSTSRRLAPSDLRRPISRVRSVTTISMMFMITMPPTTSERLTTPMRIAKMPGVA